MSDVPIRLVNTNKQPILLKKGLTLAELEAITVQESNDSGENQNSHGGNANSNCATYTAADNYGSPVQGLPSQLGPQPTVQQQQQPDNRVDDIVEQLVSDVHESVGQTYRDQLKTILNRYRKLLSVDSFDVGLIPGMEHPIDTGNAAPFRQRLRRHPPAHEKIIQAQVQELLRQDIIRPSMSPYASNVVLAKRQMVHGVYVSITER